MIQKTIYILRHGQTDFNKNRIVQGSGINSHLNETGEKQAEAFYQYHKHLPFEIALCSKLQRSQQSIQRFIDEGLQFERHTDLNEINWGIHEGQPASPELKLAYDGLIGQWETGILDASIVGGESASQLGHRLSRFIQSLKSRKEKNILLCSHGRAIRCLVCLMKRKPLTKMNRFPHQNTGLYVAQQVNDKFHFIEENIAPHLDKKSKKMY